MENKLNLIWENNSDTPLSAENLSKMVEKYSEGNILFYDEKDEILKFRANTKLPLPIVKTSAFFDFDNSLVSHDSKFYPSASDAVSYRVESGGAIAIDAGTTNLLTNGTFSSGLTGWTSEVNGTSTIAASTEEWIESNHSAKIMIDGSGNRATLSQTTTLAEGETRKVSISFYYMSVGGSLELSIVGDPTSGSPKYWKSDDPTPHWESLEANGLRSFAVSADWVRVEIPGITITGLSTRQIKIKIYSTAAGADYWIDHVQLEHQEYCSSFTSGTRENSVLEYPTNIVRLDEGLFDMEFIPKYIAESDENYLLTMKASGNDALKVKLYVSAGDVYVGFSVYNTDTNSIVGTIIDVGAIADVLYTSLRILGTWNSDTGISLYVNDDYQTQATPFTPIATNQYISFQVGGYYSESAQDYLARGLFTGLKLNLFQNSNTEISSMLATDISSDSNTYQIYENENDNIPIVPSLINLSAFPDSATFYLWLNKNLLADECFLSLTQTNVSPEGPYSRLIGGFKTDGDGLVILNTIWDIGYKVNSFVSNRLTIINKNTGEPSLDVGYDDIEEEAFLNIYESTTFNEDVEFDSTHTVLFLNGAGFSDDLTVGTNVKLYATGYLDVDNLRVDGNTISSTAGVINITSANNTNVSITASGSGILGLTGTTINMTSGTGGKINIGSIVIDGNIISSATGSDSLIQPATSKDLILASSNKIIIDDTTRIYFDDTKRQDINFDNNAAYGIGYQTNTVYNRSGSFFSWYSGGSHNDAALNAGGGDILMVLTPAGQTFSGTLADSRLYAGRVYNAVFNDIAECWMKDTRYDIEYGMVAVQTNTGVRSSIARAEKGTIGVVSNTYGYLLGQAGFDDTLSDSPKVPIAITGRVKVKIYGNGLSIGDEVVSYKNGQAIKANWWEKIFQRDRIIGRIDNKITNDLYWILVD